MNVLILCTFIATAYCAESYMSKEFIDYTDMRHYNRYEKSMNNLKKSIQKDRNESTTGNSVDTAKESTGQLQVEITRFEIFMQSLVNRFLRGANLEVSILGGNLVGVYGSSLFPHDDSFLCPEQSH